MRMFLMRLLVLICLIVGMVGLAEFLATSQGKASFIGKSQEAFAKYAAETGLNNTLADAQTYVLEAQTYLSELVEDVPNMLEFNLPEMPNVFDSLSDIKETVSTKVSQLASENNFTLPAMPDISTPSALDGLDWPESDIDWASATVYHYCFIGLFTLVHIGLYCTGGLNSGKMCASVAMGQLLYTVVVWQEGAGRQAFLDLLTPAKSVFTVLCTIIMLAAAALPPFHWASAAGVACVLGMYPAFKEHIMSLTEEDLIVDWESTAMAIACAVIFGLFLNILINASQRIHHPEPEVESEDEVATEGEIPVEGIVRQRESRSRSRASEREPTPFPDDINFDEAMEKIYSRHLNRSFI